MDQYPPNQSHPFTPHRTSRIFTDAEYWERTINDMPCTHCGCSELGNPRHLDDPRP